MRKTSMIMGIIGGSIAILFGIIYIVLSSTFFGLTTWTDSGFDSFSSAAFASIMSMETTLFLVFGICSIAAGVVGLIGGIIITRKNVMGGVLMIISAVLSLSNIIALVLFILGAVFALRQERQQPVYTPPYYPYPPQYSQPSFTQQQYPQQYPQQSAPPSQPPAENPPKPPQQ